MKPKKTADKKATAITPEAASPSPEPKKAAAKKAAAPAAAKAPAPTEEVKAAAKKTATKKAAAKKTPEATAPVEASPAPAAKPEATKKAAPKKAAVKLPAILFEDDAMPAPAASGPGQRYFLGADEPSAGLGELPESYGTGRLFLAARDPHWLYAAWDLTREQQRSYNAQSKDKHLVVRVFLNRVSGKPFSETHVHPESRHWFIHAGKGGSRFVAELGYYDKAGKWVSVSQSKSTLTPPDSLSDDLSVRFTELPVEVPFMDLIETVKQELKENVPLGEALEQLRAAGNLALPKAKELAKGIWTAAQQKALAEVVSMDSVRRIWIGSLEITELIRRKLSNELSSAAAAEFSRAQKGASGLGGLGSVSSPFGGGEQSKGFWFNVNAELIIYGATEPTAEVTIGGKVIKLRPDGSFSYRFALPDGNYDLPAVAVSADRSEARSAELKFSRHTSYHGDVGTHPQDASLQPPTADAVE
ncbi:MAG: hypothetical protein K0Q55_758 [Verrucomicrobia bacterium]|jgi:hypothetical protein|nr:hypothetical protein [Verrucomicrobiota bacterium]